MYPWLRVMYAVVAIGSRMRRSACGMNLRTFCAMAPVQGPAATAITANAANQRERRVMESTSWWNWTGDVRTRCYHSPRLAAEPAKLLDVGIEPESRRLAQPHLALDH